MLIFAFLLLNPVAVYSKILGKNFSKVAVVISCHVFFPISRVKLICSLSLGSDLDAGIPGPIFSVFFKVEQLLLVCVCLIGFGGWLVIIGEA